MTDSDGSRRKFLRRKFIQFASAISFSALRARFSGTQKTMKSNRIWKLLGIITVVAGALFTFSLTSAQFNPEINYQGKLTDNTGVAVTDGTYNMRFWLLQNTSQATSSAIWTESLTGANRVQVTNGLFSVMLGSTSALTSVDFNQALFLLSLIHI